MNITAFLPQTLSPNQIFWGEKSLKYLSTLKNASIAVFISQSFHKQNPDFLKTHLPSLSDQKVFLIHGEPTTETLADLHSKVGAVQPELLLAIGGGSVIDLAKILKKDMNIPLTALPTTLGSGAEVSQHAVTLQDGKKTVLSGLEYLPERVLIVPSLLQSLSQAQISLQIADALAHALEAFVSRGAHVVSDLYAKEAFQILWTEAIREHTEEKRSLENIYKLQVGSVFAGIAQSSVATGMAHALAHVSGALESVSHVQAVATFLPDVIEANSQHTDKYDALLKSIEIKETTLANAVKKLWIDLAIETHVFQFSDGVEVIAQMVKKDVCMMSNPYSPQVEEIQNILEKHK